MSDINILEKYNTERIYTVVHLDGKNKKIYIKRFHADKNIISRRYSFISDARGSKLLIMSNFENSRINYNYRINSGEKKTKSILVNGFIDVKGYKALGKILDNKKRMSGFSFENITLNKKVPIPDEDISDISKNNELTLF